MGEVTAYALWADVVEDRLSRPPKRTNPWLRWLRYHAWELGLVLGGGTVVALIILSAARGIQARVAEASGLELGLLEMANKNLQKRADLTLR